MTGGPPARLTALHREHLAHKATMVERDGWLLPRSYGNPVQEQAAVRKTVGLLDIGESGKIDLKSATLDAVLAAAFPGSGMVAIGRWTAAGAARVCRLTAEQALVLTAPGAAATTIAGFATIITEHPCTHLTDITGALCGLRLLGPLAYVVLERLCPVDLAPDRFPDGCLAQGPVARIHTLILRRDGADRTGYDLYVDRDLGTYLWHALLEAGGLLGITPAGRDAEEKETA